jgi:hypothetical protein
VREEYQRSYVRDNKEASMRFVIGVVLALSVGIGAYLGSAQVADSAKAPPRRVTLQVGDIAAVRHVQCQATAESRSHPLHADYLLCSKRPLSRAAASVYLFEGGVGVRVAKVGQVSCFLGTPGDLGTPGFARSRIFSASLVCNRGSGRGHRRGHIYLSVEVLPHGIAVLHEDKIVYRTGWNP